MSGHTTEIAAVLRDDEAAKRIRVPKPDKRRFWPETDGLRHPVRLASKESKRREAESHYAYGTDENECGEVFLTRIDGLKVHAKCTNTSCEGVHEDRVLNVAPSLSV